MPSTIMGSDSPLAAGRLPASRCLTLPALPGARRGIRCAAMGAEQIDFEAEGLLDGLEGEARAERLALLEQLAGEGVPLGELRRTTDAGTIMYVPADRVIVGPERFTGAEAAAQ